MAIKEHSTIDRRVMKVKDHPYKGGPVVYWMSRDQRANDNWALIHSIQLADENEVPLCVAFCLVPEYLGACIRQYGFMLKGLKELEKELTSRGIEFAMLEGYPQVGFPSFLHGSGAGLLVTDFDPLREKREWVRKLAGEITIPFHEVDAHNVVPCWLASSRRIVTFATFKEKLKPFIQEFLEEFPSTKKPREPWPQDHQPIAWKALIGRLKVDRTVKEVDWVIPGEKVAKKAMQEFLRARLSSYPVLASDPMALGQSELSPYFHFGQLSSQRVALEVRRSAAPEEAKSNFLEQLVVKKELSDNFCLHTPNYETFGAFPKWARDSLDAHRSDVREHLYTLEQFEKGQTHDPLWNAAQMELVKIGMVPGSLRKYWAQKFLEWTRGPEEALSIATYLNNRYSMDGRDPSGYTGIAYGLFGHPWASKDVIGKLRSRTYTGERLRFDTHAYEEKVRKL